MPHEDLVVLLGAGASFPGMLSTGDLTELLTQWDRMREPPPAGTASSGHSSSLASHGAGDPRRPLFAALKARLAPFVSNPATINFEHLLHMCEVLDGVLPLPTSPSDPAHLGAILSPFLQVAPSAAEYNGGLGLGLAAHWAMSALLDSVADRCATISTSHPQVTGLRELASAFRLRVFSLNYDDLPVRTGIPFYTGFDTSNPQAFRPRFPWPEDVPTFAQLHGSVLFGYRDFDLVRVTSRDAARALRNGVIGASRAQDGHRLPTVPIIAGLRKADKVLPAPFGAYMHVFRNELLRCPRWLIMGYGFADEHINAALAQARSNWSSRGSDWRAVVVDYHDFARDPGAPEPAFAEHFTPVGEFLDYRLPRVFRGDMIRFEREGAYVNRAGLSPIGDSGLSVNLDGTEFALTHGLAEIVPFLSYPATR